MTKPNVIVILCDDLGYGDLACYGSTVNKTPRLDKMAEEGLRLTDFYMASPVCSPSRAALMTGCYPKRIGLDTGVHFPVLMPGDPIGLSPDENTIATYLKGAGYATSLIGKWHLGDQEPFLPNKHGFDEYFGLPYSNDHYVGRDISHAKHLPERFQENGFAPLPLMKNEELVELEPDQSKLTHRYTEEAVDFITRKKDEPFFLYFAHMYVHTPLFPPPEFLERAKNGAYGAEVECIDWSTGVLLDTLKELGIDENTLVIFTSDNGSTGRFGASNGPLRGRKGKTWEGGMREPCIMRWPGTIPAGTESDILCSALDILPTAVSCAGVMLADDRIIDGHDLSGLLRNPESTESPYEAFFYYGSWNHELEAVRSGDWKYSEQRQELYNLREDMSESENLFENRPDKIEELTVHLDRCRHDIGDAFTGIEGKQCRAVGMVDDPIPLFDRFDTSHPYIQAYYDLNDRE